MEIGTITCDFDENEVVYRFRVCFGGVVYVLDDAHQLHDWLFSHNASLHGDHVNAVIPVLIGAGYEDAKPKGRSLRFRYGSCEFTDISAWALNIDATVDDVNKVKGLKKRFGIRGTFLSPTPGTATAIQFSSKTRSIAVDQIHLDEALIGSTSFGGFLGDGDFLPAYKAGLLANPATPGKLYENVMSMDLTSAYPAAIMVYNFPDGPSEDWTDRAESLDVRSGFISGHEDKGYVGLFHLHGVRRKPWVRLPCIQYDDRHREACSTGRWDRIGLVSGDIRVGMSTPEMMTFLLQYDVDRIEVERIFVHRVSSLPKSVRKYVADAYQVKATAEGVDRIGAKKALNSVMGIWGRDPLKKSRITQTAENAQSLIDSYNGVGGHPTSLSVRRTWDYRWALYLTSYVRYFIAKTEKDLYEAGATVLYSDTDSIKAIGDRDAIAAVFARRNSQFRAASRNYDIPSFERMFDDLGQFQDESDDYVQAIFYHKRGYVRKTATGPIDPVVAGATKNVAAAILSSTTMEELERSEGVMLEVIRIETYFERQVFKGSRLTSWKTHGRFRLEPDDFAKEEEDDRNSRVLPHQ